ncbi:MAG: chemotaxis protein CheW [Syntrophales bacterium]|nr:chemotaxis protein CheW [Syntrophales bacterium]
MDQQSAAGTDRRILESRARILAHPPKDDIAEGEILYLLSFLLGGERYGVDIKLVRETQPLESQEWAAVPCTPDFIAGAVNIRGRIYPVMNVARFFGLPARPLSKTAHVLLVSGVNGGGEEMELSLLADELPQTTRVSRNDVKAPTVTISPRAQEFIRGITDDMLIILDLKRLLSDPGIIVHEEV